MIGIPDFSQPAACEGMETEHWFSESQDGYAKRVCGRCPAKQECLAWALKNHEWGIWGGTTMEERRVMLGGSPRLTQPRPVAERKPRRNLTPTKREQALKLTDEGWSAAEIATELRIHERTVRVIRAEARDSA